MASKDALPKVKRERLESQDKEEHSHTFTFHDHSKTTANIISCKKAQTVLEALKTSPKFTTLLRKNKGKDIIIEKQKPVNADIATHFPCWLIEKDEELTIQFSSKNKSDPESPERGIITEESKLITFCFERTGGDNCKSKPLLKNKIGGSLLCIYACEGETAEEALQRDGRFTDIVFQRDNDLEYFNKGKRVLLEINVPLTDEQDGKTFRLIMERKKPSQTTTKTDSGPQIAEQAAEPAQKPGEPTPSSATSAPANPPAQEWGESTSGSAEDLLKILHSQFKGLVEHMKERENVREDGKVLELLREEYGKNIKVFWDVYRVKNLMEMSRSVCILFNKTAEGIVQGTGFLLFDRFILTNAHLIENSHDSIDVNFCYEIEHIKTGVRLPIKVIAWAYGLVDKKYWLDYALLELDESTANLPPPLLTQYGPPIEKGGMCIIGHPNERVKGVDFCSVIESTQRETSSEKNKYLIQWMKWDLSLVAKDSPMTTYDTCFFHGASGSPVFNADGQVVAMHTGGYSYKLDETKSVIEYAIPLQHILEHLWKTMKELKSGIQSLIGVAEEQEAPDPPIAPDTQPDPDNHVPMETSAPPPLLEHFLKMAKEGKPDILQRFIEVAEKQEALRLLIAPDTQPDPPH